MWYSWFIMIKPISVLPHLLNWIIFWIEFFWNFLNWIIFWIEFLWKILNWIIFWIEFSWNTIELNIELNNFLAKFKYWIESIWVSLTPTKRGQCPLFLPFFFYMRASLNCKSKCFIILQIERHLVTSTIVKHQIWFLMKYSWKSILRLVHLLLPLPSILKRSFLILLLPLQYI